MVEKKTYNAFIRADIENLLMQECGEFNVKKYEQAIYEEDIQGCLISNKQLKIPSITHRVWFTNSDNPIEAKKIENTISSINIASEDNIKWQHILWTNDINLIPNTTKLFLSYGGEVRQILESGINLDIINIIFKYIDLKNYVVASDIFRYAILNKYGGVYFDIDYLQTHSIKCLLISYKFFAGVQFNIEAYPYSLLGNAIIGSQKEHIILIDTLNIILRNINNIFAPEYIKSSYNMHSKILFSTFYPITIATCKNGDFSQGNDMVFKEGSLYNSCKDLDNLSLIDVVLGSFALNTWLHPILTAINFLFDIPSNIRSLALITKSKQDYYYKYPNKVKSNSSFDFFEYCNNKSIVNNIKFGFDESSGDWITKENLLPFEEFLNHDEL